MHQFRVPVADNPDGITHPHPQLTIYFEIPCYFRHKIYKKMYPHQGLEQPV